jgi:hypothetical protein
LNGTCRLWAVVGLVSLGLSAVAAACALGSAEPHVALGLVSVATACTGAVVAVCVGGGTPSAGPPGSHGP